MKLVRGLPSRGVAGRLRVMGGGGGGGGEGGRKKRSEVAILTMG